MNTILEILSRMLNKIESETEPAELRFSLDRSMGVTEFFIRCSWWASNYHCKVKVNPDAANDGLKEGFIVYEIINVYKNRNSKDNR